MSSLSVRAHHVEHGPCVVKPVGNKLEEVPAGGSKHEYSHNCQSVAEEGHLLGRQGCVGCQELSEHHGL